MSIDTSLIGELQNLKFSTGNEVHDNYWLNMWTDFTISFRRCFCKYRIGSI